MLLALLAHFISNSLWCFSYFRSQNSENTLFAVLVSDSGIGKLVSFLFIENRHCLPLWKWRCWTGEIEVQTMLRGHDIWHSQIVWCSVGQSHGWLVGVESFLEKENFLVVIIQGQMLEVESTSQKVILFQGFILSFCYHHNSGQERICAIAVFVDTYIWIVKSQSSSLMLERPSLII